MKLRVEIELESLALQIAEQDAATIRLFIQDIIFENDYPDLREAVLADMLRLVRPEDGWTDAYNPDSIESSYPEI